MQSPSPSCPQRFASLAVALVLAASHLLSLTHEATTAHEVCPEHGERVEVASPLGRQAQQVLDGDEAVLHASDAEGLHEESHHHCGAWLTRRTQALAASVQQVLIAPGEVQAPALRCVAWTHCGPALLLLAPKSSPPRV